MCSGVNNINSDVAFLGSAILIRQGLGLPKTKYQQAEREEGEEEPQMIVTNT